MKKLSGKLNIGKKFGIDQVEKWSNELRELLKQSVVNESKNVEDYINQLKKLNPNIKNDELSEKIISRRSLKAGGIGALCGLGGFITFPLTMPVDLYYTFRIQAKMVLSIASIYGWNIDDEDTITDILLVMGGNAGIATIKEAGIKIGQELGKKAVNKFTNREVMKKINKVLSRKIITKAGEKSFTSFSKLVPVVGAPIGAAFDYFGTLSIGKTALKFYSG